MGLPLLQVSRCTYGPSFGHDYRPIGLDGARKPTWPRRVGRRLAARRRPRRLPREPLVIPDGEPGTRQPGPQRFRTRVPIPQLDIESEPRRLPRRVCLDVALPTQTSRAPSVGTFHRDMWCQCVVRRAQPTESVSRWCFSPLRRRTTSSTLRSSRPRIREARASR